MTSCCNSFLVCNSNASPSSDTSYKRNHHPNGCNKTAKRSATPKKKGTPCLTSPLFWPNIYTVVVPYLLRQKSVRKQAISPKGCHQSSGSRCQTSYRSDQSTGSRVQDLPYRGKSNMAENVFSVALLPFFGQFSHGKLLETQIAIQFWRQESQQRIRNCINITMCCNLILSEVLTLNPFLHYSSLIPNTTSDLRFINCCSSWEVMLTRWAPCMRHSLSAASQLFLWG